MSVTIILMLISVAEAAPFAYIPDSIHNVTVIDIATNKVTSTVNVSGEPEGVGVFGIAATQDGKKVYVEIGDAGDSKYFVGTIDTATNTVTAIVDIGSCGGPIAVTPDGKKLYAVNGHNAMSAGNTVSVINTTTNTVTNTVTVGLGPGGIAITPDGTRVYVANGGGTGGFLYNPEVYKNPGTISVIDTATDVVIDTVNIIDEWKWGPILDPSDSTGTKLLLDQAGRPVAPAQYLTAIAAGSDGKVYVGNLIYDPTSGTSHPDPNLIGTYDAYSNNRVYMPTVSVIDTATNTITAPFHGVDAFGSLLGEIVVSPDGQTVYTLDISGSAANNWVDVINPATNTIIAKVPVGNSESGIAITPDGTKVLTTNYTDGTVSVINTTTNTVTTTITGKRYPGSICISPGPGLNLTMVANTTNYSYVGQQILYTYNVTNLGDVIIPGPITVNNNITGTTTISNSDLAPGQSVTGPADYTIGVQNLVSGTLSDSAIATSSNGEQSNTATDTVPYYGFLPKPNGFSFKNFGNDKKDTSGNIITPFLFGPDVFYDIYGQSPDKEPYKTFFDYAFKDVSGEGNCFGFSAASLVLYNNYINKLHGSPKDPYDYPPTDLLPSEWVKLSKFPIPPQYKFIRQWISLYQAIQFSKGVLASEGEHHGWDDVCTTIRDHIFTKKKWDLQIDAHAIKPQIGAHSLVPYYIDSSNKIWVYDSNYPITSDKPPYPVYHLTYDPGTHTITEDDGTVYDYIGLIDFAKAIDVKPEIPLEIVIEKLKENKLKEQKSKLLFTDNVGNKLGYDQGILKDEINGCCPMVTQTLGNNNSSAEGYYVPPYYSDPSIKMELYGNGSDVSEIDMITPNGLIVANVTVSPNSIDEFKILNNGTGLYFNSENDTTQSLSLMLEVETPNYAQIVNANLSQIEKGGSFNLSNDNGTITIQNNGLQRTGNFTIEQMISGQNSSINLTNIGIKGNSTVNIVPSNWNDLANSTVTIEDFGSNGQVYSTEIITYKNSQVTQAIDPGAALTIQKSASPTSYDDIGQTITYTYKVTNSGNVDISAPITVTDDKFGTVPIQNSGTLSPGSSVTGTATYKITDADINTGSVANVASATGSFSGQPITSSNTVIEIVHYKPPTNDKAHDSGPDNGGYGTAVVPVVPSPMMYSSPMYGSVPGGYGSEPYGYTSGPSTTETQNSESNGHKAKAHLSKHKHKHHTTKHHKTAKNHTKQRT